MEYLHITQLTTLNTNLLEQRKILLSNLANLNSKLLRLYNIDIDKDSKLNLVSDSKLNLDSELDSNLVSDSNLDSNSPLNLVSDSKLDSDSNLDSNSPLNLVSDSNLDSESDSDLLLERNMNYLYDICSFDNMQTVEEIERDIKCLNNNNFKTVEEIERDMKRLNNNNNNIKTVEEIERDMKRLNNNTIKTIEEIERNMKRLNNDKEIEIKIEKKQYMDFMDNIISVNEMEYINNMTTKLFNILPSKYKQLHTQLYH